MFTGQGIERQRSRRVSAGRVRAAGAVLSAVVVGSLTVAVGPTEAATAAAASAATVVTVGQPCRKTAKAVDERSLPVTCTTTPAGKIWVWSSPVPSPVPADAPVPPSWEQIVVSAEGANADAPSPALPGIYPNRAAMEARLVEIINAERTRRGLRVLTVDPRLTQLSRWWAERMNTAEYGGRGTSHCPNTVCVVRVNELGYPSFGEVVRPTSPFPAGDMANERFFVDSPRHLAILTNPKVTHIGFGVVIVGEPGSQSLVVVGQVGRSR
jgi:uncharacterized protein YkwD